MMSNLPSITTFFLLPLTAMAFPVHSHPDRSQVLSSVPDLDSPLLKRSPGLGQDAAVVGVGAATFYAGTIGYAGIIGGTKAAKSANEKRIKEGHDNGIEPVTTRVNRLNGKFQFVDVSSYAKWRDTHDPDILQRAKAKEAEGWLVWSAYRDEDRNVHIHASPPNHEIMDKTTWGIPNDSLSRVADWKSRLKKGIKDTLPLPRVADKEFIYPPEAPVVTV